MRLFGVPAVDLDAWLPQIGWHLGEFAKAGHWTADDFADQIRARDRQLWIVAGDDVKAVGLTNVCADRLKTVQVTHCCGEDAKAWAGLFEGVCEWARQIGSKKMEVICRPGWERLLGLEKTHVVLEKRL